MRPGESVAGGSFRPPPGLRHPHLQSMLAGWGLRRRFIVRAARTALSASRPAILECSGGVRLLGHHSAHPSAARGTVVLLHGWEGCADSPYILSTSRVLYEAGFDLFRLNFRDHGGTHALNEDLFHSCRIEEVLDAIGIVQREYARGPLFVAGYSLGGNFAVRVAARSRQAGLELRKVIAVSPVLRPHSTMRALDEGFWIYRHYFLTRWRRSLLAKAAAFPRKYDFGDLRRFSTLSATTEFFVRRYTEFPDLDSYLAGYAIVGQALERLEVPTSILAAADDPVVPSADFADLYPSKLLGVTLVRSGGHCAFIQDYRLRSWLDRRVPAELMNAL